MAVFGPRAHAQPHVEESLGLLRRRHDAPHLRRVAAEGLLAEHVLAGRERRADDVGVVRRGHADVHDVDVRVGDERIRAFVDRHARQVERLRIVAASDVPDDGGHVARALLRIDVREGDDPCVLESAVDAPVGRAHEARSDDSDVDAFHFCLLSFCRFGIPGTIIQ